MDLRATPVGGAYPGVEVHANLIAGMLDNNIKRQPGYLPAAEVFQLILIGGLLVVFLPLLSPIRAMLLAMTSLASVLAFNLWLWHSFNLVMPVAATIFLLIVLYGLNMTWSYFVESRSKRQFAELFGQYVPPELVDEMAKNPESYSMEGRNAELTVLFALGRVHAMPHLHVEALEALLVQRGQAGHGRQALRRGHAEDLDALDQCLSRGDDRCDPRQSGHSRQVYR